MHDVTEPAHTDPSELYTIYDAAERSTKSVSERLQAELDKTPELDFLVKQFGSYVYSAGQKLIDRKVKTGETRARDDAVIFSCPRLFNECFAGYSLARSGLVLQAIVQLRSAFEITTQAMLFMANEDVALRWLQGRRVAPKEVRAKSRFAAQQKDLYDRLARLSHPNLEAVRYYSVPVPSREALAHVYGGGFFPKAAGQICMQLLFAQLVFLEAFYATYQDDLAAHGLLWRPDVPEAVMRSDSEFNWARFLGMMRDILTKLTEKYNSLPDDAIGLSEHITKPPSNREKET